MDRRQVLFPPLGERVYLRRPWVYSRVPLAGWAWYAQEAWTSAAALALGAFCGLPAILLLLMGHGRTAARVGFAFLAILAVAAVVQPLFFRPRVRVSARLPARVAAGDSFETAYEVANLSRRRSAYDLAVETLLFPNPLELRFRPAFVAHLPPGATALCAGRCAPLLAAVSFACPVCEPYCCAPTVSAGSAPAASEASFCAGVSFAAPFSGS